MKRRPPVLMVLMLLVAGAIVNVVVAWRYGMHWGFPELPMTSMGRGDQSVVQVALFGVTLTERNLQTGSWESATWSIHQEMEAGFPCHSMRASRTQLGGATVEQNSVWEVNMPLLGLRTLPCGIRPAGFAINTVFYAGVLWLLFAAPLALRRRRRIKRGLCPKCAYPVGDSPVCTECGATVNRIAR